MIYKFHTDLSKEDCVSLLTASINPQNTANFGNSVVLGKINGDSFYFDLFSMGSLGARTSTFNIRFNGTLTGLPDGTLICGDFSMAKSTKIIIAIGLLWTMLIIILGIINYGLRLSVFVYAFTIGVLPLAIIYKMFSPNNNKKTSLNFIQQTLKAKII